MAKTRSALRDDLNTYTGDSANTIWTEAQKNLSINLAIRAGFPEIKTVAKTSFTLTAASYRYALGATELARTMWGPAQIWCATTATDKPFYREMRRSVLVRREGSSWELCFDEGWVDDPEGYIVEVFYDQYYDDLDTDSAETDCPPSYLVPRAMYHLCTMEALSGHHSDVETFRRLRPDFFEEAERERRKWTTLPLARSISIRWE